MSRNVPISSPALGHTQNQFNKTLNVSETATDTRLRKYAAAAAAALPDTVEAKFIPPNR